jgi:hypothetical protein
MVNCKTEDSAPNDTHLTVEGIILKVFVAFMNFLSSPFNKNVFMSGLTL